MMEGVREAIDGGGDRGRELGRRWMEEVREGVREAIDG